MIVVTIQFNMNNTTSSDFAAASNKTELMVLVILIKLSIFCVYKLAQMCVKIYKKHNEKVINTHMIKFKEFNKAKVAEQTENRDVETAT